MLKIKTVILIFGLFFSALTSKYLYLLYSQKKRYTDTEKAFYSPFYLKSVSLFERKDLKELIENVMNSKTRYYLIVGENGVGKTTLVQSVVKDLKEKENREILYIDVEDPFKFGGIFAAEINFDFSIKQSSWNLLGNLSIFSKNIYLIKNQKELLKNPLIFMVKFIKLLHI